MVWAWATVGTNFIVYKIFRCYLSHRNLHFLNLNTTYENKKVIYRNKRVYLIRRAHALCLSLKFDIDICFCAATDL